MERALRGVATRGAVLFALCLLGRVDGFTAIGKPGSINIQRHGGKQGLCLKRASRMMVSHIFPGIVQTPAKRCGVFLPVLVSSLS